MIDKNSKRMGAARFGHRTPGTVLGLPHPPLSRAPHGGADDEAQVGRSEKRQSAPPSCVGCFLRSRASSAGPAVRWLLSELERASTDVPPSPNDERARHIYILVY